MMIFKKIGSVLIAVALMCSVVLLPVAASDTEPTIIYNRDFDTDDSESYVHNTEIADEMTADVFTITEGANKGVKGENGTTGKSGTFYGYFSKPYTEATDGILHISYDTTMNKVTTNDVYYSLVVKTNTFPNAYQNMWLGVRYANKFGYRTSWQGSNRMPINATFSSWNSNTETLESIEVGDTATKTNTIEYYVDLKAKAVAIIVNDTVGPIMSLSKIQTNRQKNQTGDILPTVTEDVKSIEGIVLPLTYKSVTKADGSTVIIGEEVLYDNIKAEILPFDSMGEIPELALGNPIAFGGIKNLSAETYSGAVETSIKDENDNAVKGIKLPLDYDFGETITAENSNVLHAKFDVLATENATDYSQFNLMPGAGNTKHWFLSVDKTAIRNGGSIWTNWNGSAVNNFYDETAGTDYRVNIEAYLDLKLGKAAIKYGENTEWMMRELPSALIESGIKAFNISYENKSETDGEASHDEIFIDNLTIEKLNGGLLFQGVDFGYVGIPYSNQYETDNSAIVESGTNKAAQVERGKSLSYRFIEPINTGKVYISFDFKSKEQDGLKSKKAISLIDGNGNALKRIGMFYEKIALIKPGNWNNNGDDAHKYSVPADKCGDWYHIDIILDYESATLDDDGNDTGTNAHFYCNGRSIGNQILPANGILGIKMDIVDEPEGTEPYFIDNVKIDRITGIADVTDKYGTELTADADVEAGKYKARALLEDTDEDASNKRLILVWYDGKILIGCKMSDFSKLKTAGDNKSAVAEAITEMEITSNMAAAGNTMKAYIWDMASGALRPIGNEKIK